MKDSEKENQITRREFFQQSASKVLPWLVSVAFVPVLLDSCSPSSLIDSNEDDDDIDSSGNSNQLNVSEATGTKGGVEYVDLGLGALWARSNFEATKPSKSGKFCHVFTTSRSDSTAPGYKGLDKGDDYAGTIYDVVFTDGASGWRLPTLSDYLELINNCKLSNFEYDGVKGLLLTSKKNGESIFFPFTGYRSWSYYDKKYTLEGSGKRADLLVGTLRARNDTYLMYVASGKMEESGGWDEMDQFPVRAVCKGGGSSGGGQSGCNNNCSNSATSSSCHGCGQSCSGSCTNGCSVNCGGRCTTSCGGTCSYVSAGSSCSGCAKTCYNQCYTSCSSLCYTTCNNDCIYSAY